MPWSRDDERHRRLWIAVLVLLAACAQQRSPCCAQHQSPCSPRPGFDQELQKGAPGHTTEGPGIVHVRSPGTRAEVVDTLRAVARARRDAPPDGGRLDIEVDIPLALFQGLSCSEIFEPFNAVDFCSKRPGEAKLPFYRLPPNWYGGGRTLNLHFDESGRCDGARWCFTE